MMEIGKGFKATPGERVVEEVVTSVGVEEEGTTEKLPFKAVVLLQIDYSKLPACARIENSFLSMTKMYSAPCAWNCSWNCLQTAHRISKCGMVMVLDLMARYMQLLKAIN